MIYSKLKSISFSNKDPRGLEPFFEKNFLMIEV